MVIFISTILFDAYDKRAFFYTGHEKHFLLIGHNNTSIFLIDNCPLDTMEA